MGGIQGGDSIHTASFQAIISAQTAATGTNWVNLPAQACNAVNICNATGTTIEVRYNGTGTGLPVANLTTYSFMAISNSNQLSIRRLDVSNTQVTVVGQALQP